MLSTGSMEKSGFSVIDSEELFRINGGADQTIEEVYDTNNSMSVTSSGKVGFDEVSGNPKGEVSGSVTYTHSTSTTTTVTTTQTVPDRPYERPTHKSKE